MEPVLPAGSGAGLSDADLMDDRVRLAAQRGDSNDASNSPS